MRALWPAIGWVDATPWRLVGEFMRLLGCGVLLVYRRHLAADPGPTEDRGRRRFPLIDGPFPSA